MKGLGVAIITPFLPDGSIDFPALERLVDDLVQKRVDYLGALGTTSESPTLSPDEKRQVVQCVASVNDGRLPLVMGVGGPNTIGVARLSENRPIDEVIAIVDGIRCGPKPTSCPDQLGKALKQIKAEAGL